MIRADELSNNRPHRFSVAPGPAGPPAGRGGRSRRVSPDCAAASFLIARRIQHVIAAPLLELAGAARTISTSQDYTVRVTPANNDEVGGVIQAFNAMLDRIGERNSELSRANRSKDEFLATLIDRRVPDVLLSDVAKPFEPEVLAQTVAALYRASTRLA
jgi:signal transduction histidine kinase